MVCWSAWLCATAARRPAILRFSFINSSHNRKASSLSTGVTHAGIHACFGRRRLVSSYRYTVRAIAARFSKQSTTGIYSANPFLPLSHRFYHAPPLRVLGFFAPNIVGGGCSHLRSCSQRHRDARSTSFTAFISMPEHYEALP